VSPFHRLKLAHIPGCANVNWLPDIEADSRVTKPSQRRRLTASEREIRASRGIAVARFWPFAVMFVAVTAMSFDDQIFLRCIGHTLEGGGRAGALISMAMAIPCSPFYLSGSPVHYFVFGALWGSAPFAVMQILWMRRHKAYWDGVRAREKIRRAERRVGTPESAVVPTEDAPG
jgi:hypothetical protein